MAFDIHVTDEFARNLNGYFLAMVNGIKNDEWLKKGRMQFAPTNHLTDKISILPLSKFVYHLPFYRQIEMFRRQSGWEETNHR